MEDITDFELFLITKHITILEEIAQNELSEKREKYISQLLDSLFINFFYLNHNYAFDKVYRTTINKNILKANKRIKDIRNLKYPPDGIKIEKFGRCNLPGQSIFYGSLMQMTSLNELRPKVGDLITETLWVPKSNEPLLYIPIFLNQPTTEPIINSETGEVIERLINMRTYQMKIVLMIH